MTLNLLNLQSKQLIKLDNENPLIIGRGNVEGCFDKRVSRNHGRITCTLDGKINVEALHCNPCFITRNGVPPVLQINKNEKETLGEGDFLGLLPNAFWFKVTKEKDTNIKKESPKIKTEVICDENNQTKELLENETTTNQKEKELQDSPLSSIVNNKETSSSLSNTNPSGALNGFGTPEFEKTRKLPLWMYEIDESVQETQITNKRSLASDKSTNKKKQKTSKENEVEREQGVSSNSGSDLGDEISILDVPSTSRIVKIEGSVPASSDEPETEDLSKEINNKKEGYESDVKNSEECGSRPICQYESNCYRKNPQHKLEFSHPGDSDYVAYEERPLCPYGAACYRKNEKHKVEFRHPKPSTSQGSIASSPLPAKRMRKKLEKESSDIEDSDEYDLEDPFINDASSDEYVPTDLDSGEEDLDASRDDD